MTKLTHSAFLFNYFNSLHVSSNLVLIIRRINCINTTPGICHSVSVTVSRVGRRRSPTQSDIYQMLYWYNWFSCRWARGCSEHVENRNKYIEKNCASSWLFTRNLNITLFIRESFKHWKREREREREEMGGAAVRGTEFFYGSNQRSSLLWKMQGRSRLSLWAR